ncbi:hypothetical protein Dcae01_02043 [Deinococcus caeni]|uniref:Restriction endonuclease type IV Mrr domain-containing protein n=1 Tax=Deinococcus caeni TaxID=569127 RepID=A0ABP9UE93_9DEIO
MQGFPGTAHPSFLPARRGWRRSCHLLRSKVVRQIDCLIEARFSLDKSRRILVDAKNYKSKIDINDVEKFHGMMFDCEAAYGLLICPSGWTEGAFARSGDFIGLKLLSLEDIDTYAGAEMFEDCSCCTDGVVMYDGHWGMEVSGLIDFIMTGKCDRCRSFNVWHWGCGEKFAVEDEHEEFCSCGFKWFVIGPDPNDLDDPDRMSAFLLLYGNLEGGSELGFAGVSLLDRRPG